MQIEHSTRDGCRVVTLTGQINLSTVPLIRRALLKDYAKQPPAIICDLSGVDTLDPICATIFATVANHPTSRWPATTLLLCGAQPAVAQILGRLGVPHVLPLYASLDQALKQTSARPPYLRQELPLAPAPTAPAAARLFVRETLQDWRLAPPDEELSDQALLLADELVTNAVVHARTDLRLRLELRGELLHLAVHDLGSAQPRPGPADPDREGGRGLQVVAQVAKIWGVHRDPEGGKVVWCILQTAQQRRQP